MQPIKILRQCAQGISGNIQYFEGVSQLKDFSWKLFETCMQFEAV
jgi:hypothetical protein